MKNKEKNKINKKRFLIALLILTILLLITTIIIIIVIPKNTTSNNTTSTETARSYYESKKAKQNPYEIITDYDGTYEFEYTNTDRKGTIYTSKGFLNFKNGICKIIYMITSNGNIVYEKREYQGYCGINKFDDTNLNFILYDDTNCDVKRYTFTLDNTNMTAKQLEGSDVLSNYSRKDMQFIFINQDDNITEIFNKMKTEYTQLLKEEKIAREKAEAERIAHEKAEAEKKIQEDFKNSCAEYTFERLARNPDKIKGTNVKLTGKVIQVLYDTNSVNLRVNITKKGNYSTYYTDTIYVTYIATPGEDKILENDIITIYGTAQGDYTYNSILNKPVTLPLISAKYITIEK